MYAALMRAPEVEAVVEELSCGDYLLRSDFAVERKEATDFINSIMDRRLFAQVARLKVEFERVLFVLEGDPYATRSGIPPEAVRGAISYLMTIEGVSVNMVPSHQETTALLLTMARHLQHGLGYDVPLRGDKPKDLRDLAQFLVEGLPGVGAKTARALVGHFGSARAVFEASEQALCQVNGVGAKSAARIREALEFQASGRAGT